MENLTPDVGFPVALIVSVNYGSILDARLFRVSGLHEPAFQNAG
jgi:hypothetical protein